MTKNQITEGHQSHHYLIFGHQQMPHPTFLHHVERVFNGPRAFYRNHRTRHDRIHRGRF